MLNFVKHKNSMCQNINNLNMSNMISIGIKKIVKLLIIKFDLGNESNKKKYLINKQFIQNFYNNRCSSGK